jgi:hypothetical protein
MVILLLGSLSQSEATQECCKRNNTRDTDHLNSAAQYAAYWATHPEVDFTVSRVGPSAALRYDTARYWGYTAVWNILDLPACVFLPGELCSSQLHPTR